MRATTTAACLGVVLIALPCASAVAGHGPARHGTSRHLHISSRFHIVPPIRSEILAQSRFGLQRLRIREPRRFADFGTLLPLGFGVADAPEVMLAAEPLRVPSATAPSQAVAAPLPRCRETVAGVIVERGMACGR